MYQDYKVIIIGGGPVGVALGIELGLQNIKTLILEKYDKPLQTPRAQSLSARTMEFFLRWNIDKTLEEKVLLPQNIPPVGVWCSALNGETYSVTAWGDNRLLKDASPKEGIRIPLWITEEVLRNRLHDFPCIDFLKNHEVQNITVLEDKIIVQSYDKENNLLKSHQASYLACCDGASGSSKGLLNNSFIDLSEKSKMLCVNFLSDEVMSKKTVSDAMYYSISSETVSSIFLPIDIAKGLWATQIIWTDSSLNPDEKTLSDMLDKMMGSSFNKTIFKHYFWDMQIQIADRFSVNNRIFWLGDAAHASTPIGALGLNTGFGDAENLGWKLASVINKQSTPALLDTYELERRPVCMNNLNFSRERTAEFVDVKKKYPPNDDFRAFAMANAELSTRILSSSGLTMGYCYVDSPLTQANEVYDIEVSPFEYLPQVKPGYFLPHTADQHNVSIYEILSPIQWNLLICGQEKLDQADYFKVQSFCQEHKINILSLDDSRYPYTYLLLRPDWHIAHVGENLENLGKFYERSLKSLV